MTPTDDEGITRGVIAADVTGDGFLDLIKRDWLGPARLLVNRCQDQSWLSVNLRDEGLNTRAVGAKVRVRADTDEDRWLTRWVTAGGLSVASGGPGEVHFGLGEAQVVEVHVYWPDGEVSVFDEVSVRTQVTIYRTWERP